MDCSLEEITTHLYLSVGQLTKEEETNEGKTNKDLLNLSKCLRCRYADET